MDDKFYLRQGTSQNGAFSLVVTPERAGWTYSGLKVLTLLTYADISAVNPTAMTPWRAEQLTNHGAIPTI